MARRRVTGPGESLHGLDHPTAGVARDDLYSGERLAVCSATTVRAPWEMTWSFVTYHLNLGIDRMYVFLDDPADPAGPRLSELPGVTVVRCDAAHWARLGVDGGRAAPIETRILANTNEAFRRARMAGYDWFVHLDADELLHTSIGLRQLLTDAPGRVDALLLPLLEAVPARPDHARPFEEIIDFKEAGLKRNLWNRYRLPGAHAPQWDRYQRRLRVARRLGCRTIRGSEYYRGAHMPRSIIRITDQISHVLVKGPLMIGGGRPRAQIAETANLLHFDGFSYRVWLLKWQWRRDGTATAVRMREERRKYKDEFDAAYRAQEPGGLQRLFRRRHMVTGWERFVLRSIGLLREIRIDPTLFRGAG
jgi:hypothetical protein